MNIYKQLYNSGIIKRTHMKFATLAASVLISCRIHRFPISFEEIYEISTERPDKIRKAYFDILEELKLKIRPLELEDYILHYSNLLNLSPKEKMKALKMAAKISKKLNISGKKISGYCGAIIKHVTNKTYLELENKIKAASPTIGARYREIKNLVME